MEGKGKIIGVGFQKTGTTSLGDALEILGFRVKGNTPRLLIPILKGKFDPVIRMIQAYDAVEDTPWYLIYKELDKRIPGSKFILTIRDEESWYRSISRHVGLLKNPQREWIYGRGKGVPMKNRENTIDVYTRHNQGVQEYFRDRPEDLLVLDFTKGDGWEKLCRFLDVPEPDIAFPHSNRWKGKGSRNEYYGKKKNFKYLRKQFKHTLKIKYIDLMKYW